MCLLMSNASLTLLSMQFVLFLLLKVLIYFGWIVIDIVVHWMLFPDLWLIVLTDQRYCHSIHVICCRFEICMSEWDPLKLVALNNLDITNKLRKHLQMVTWAFHHDKILSGHFPRLWPSLCGDVIRWPLCTEAQACRAVVFALWVA